MPEKTADDRLERAYMVLESVSQEAPETGTEKRARGHRLELAIIELDAAAKAAKCEIDRKAGEDKLDLAESVKAAKHRARQAVK